MAGPRRTGAIVYMVSVVTDAQARQFRYVLGNGTGDRIENMPVS